MRRTLLTPILVLSGIVLCCSLMATTNIFDSLVLFIHTGEITVLQALACLLFTAGGFGASIYLLNLICGYFVPRITTETNTTKTQFQTKHIGEV